MNDAYRSHADRWLAAWNTRDLEAILACYDPNVIFTAPTVVTRWNRPDGTLRGTQELRKHFARGLELAPDLSFTEEALLAGVNGYSLFYKRENKNLALDVVELGDDGLTTRATAFYAQHQA